MTAPLLEIRCLAKDYQVRRAEGLGHEVFHAVADVSFSLAPGGSLAIVGESGSGKSTTARILVGLERATAGEIRVDDEDWQPTRRLSGGERRRRARKVQMVFQDPYLSLDRRQTVRACLDDALRLHTDLDKAGRAARAAELLDQVRLDAGSIDKRPRSLSGGQRQRATIARSLAAGPELLVLDEAVASQVLATLQELRERTGIAYVFISHDLPVVAQLCEDVVVMKDGRIVEAGRTGDVLGHPQHEYTKRLIDSVPRPGWKPRRHRIHQAESAVESVKALAPEGLSTPVRHQGKGAPS
jgi:peptide/nickel transport system ATP-binding protein